jgi:BirA family transcriptional regulator, biotin operon repressor / biotin---[acetyl-CoA-carboxylase] ligase
MSEEFQTTAAAFPEPYRLLVRETVESTNDEARQLGQTGAADGLIVLAKRQTLGRGRRGAAWFSPGDEALAFSILLRPTEPKSLWPRLALAAGLAVAEALESVGLEAGIKWPNDIWIGRRKVAGILVEAGSDFAVLGIGLNVNITEFPRGVSEIATSLRIEGGREFSRAEVLGEVVRHFSRRRHQIESAFDEVIAAVQLRCVLRGKCVSLHTANGPKTGVVEGMAPGGELLLKSAAGLERLIQADEVRIVEA